MKPVTETHPELIGASFDMAKLTGLLDEQCSHLAGSAHDLNHIVRKITQDHTPETLSDSARAIGAAGDATTKAFFLSIRLKEHSDAGAMKELMTTVVSILNDYEQATLAEDEELWMDGFPARAV